MSIDEIEERAKALVATSVEDCRGTLGAVNGWADPTAYLPVVTLALKLAEELEQKKTRSSRGQKTRIKMLRALLAKNAAELALLEKAGAPPVVAEEGLEPKVGDGPEESEKTLHGGAPSETPVVLVEELRVLRTGYRNKRVLLARRPGGEEVVAWVGDATRFRPLDLMGKPMCFKAVYERGQWRRAVDQPLPRRSGKW